MEGLSKLRIGKAVEMELEAPDEAEARRRLELLSDRLLANPVIEDWSLVMPSTYQPYGGMPWNRCSDSMCWSITGGVA